MDEILDELGDSIDDETGAGGVDDEENEDGKVKSPGALYDDEELDEGVI